MADAFTAKIVTEVKELADEFIFSTIYPFCSQVVEMHISKKELTDALLLWKNLVRCKDCKHAVANWASLDGNEGVACGRFRNEWWDKRLNDDFCSYGERREGNGNKELS